MSNFIVSVYVNEVVYFEDNSIAGNLPATYDWDLGDGSAHSDLKSPSHSYSAPGEYTVRLTITDADGDVSSTTQVIIVKASPSSSGGKPGVAGYPTLLLNLIIGLSIVVLIKKLRRAGIKEIKRSK